MAHEAVFAKARLDRRIIRSRALVEAHRNVEFLQQRIERVPVGRMPVAAVEVIRPYEGADRAVVVDTAQQFGAGHIDVVHRQHRRHLELVRAVLDEFVDPVVIGAADRGRELRVHIVARQERQPGGREQYRDIDAFHRHAHDLRLGVVAALDGEHHVRVGAFRDKGPTDAVVLRNVAVIAGRGAVEIPQRTAAHPGRTAIHSPYRRGHAMLEFGVEVFIEQIGRLHDVHIAIDKAITVFHSVAPC